jgi:predicted CXXCH cytochrome family protein
MKSFFFIIAVLAFAIIQTTSSFAAMEGSPHDLTDDGFDEENELCKFCHITHNPLSQTNAPLWNHTDSNQTFTFYDSSTGSASSITLMCLSCHDGVTNIDAFGGAAGTMNMESKFPGTTAVIGTDLRNDHPVYVDYIVTPGKFKDVSGSTTVKVYNGKIECSSCHNPHLIDNGKFLRASNENSALCLTCHDK